MRLRKVVEAKFPEHMAELDIALHTGMRRSEQYQRITWDCVDLARRDLRIPNTKNGLTRHVPLSSEAVAAFRLLFQRSKGDGKGPIFVGERGKPLEKPRHWFEPAVKQAGINNFMWHDLRHTFASRLVMAGADLRTVQEMLGHKTIQMTCRYAHLARSHKLAAVERLVGWKLQEEASDTTSDTAQKATPETESRTVN